MMTAARRRRPGAPRSGRVQESSEPAPGPQASSPPPAQPRRPNRPLLAAASVLFAVWFVFLLGVAVSLR